MLNGGALDGAHLTVTVPSDDSEEEEEEESDEQEQPTASETTTPPSETTTVEQSDKVRASLAAQYLAKGYTLSDQIYQRAIELDAQRGISRRFVGYIQTLDTTVGQKTLGPEKTVSGVVSGRVSQTFGAASQAFGSASQTLGGASRSLGQAASQTFTQARERARSIDESAGLSSRAGTVSFFALSVITNQSANQYLLSTTVLHPRGDLPMGPKGQVTLLDDDPAGI